MIIRPHLPNCFYNKRSLRSGGQNTGLPSGCHSMCHAASTRGGAIRSSVMILLVILALLLSGCGDSAGVACEITGSGFTARHDCRSKCLSRWTVYCLDEARIMPKMCAGKEDCAPGSCPSGQFCYHFDDPFNEVSYCLPDNVCGTSPDAAGVELWERRSLERAAAMRARYKRNRPAKESALESGSTAAGTAQSRLSSGR